MKYTKYFEAFDLLVFRPEGKLNVETIKKYYEEIRRLGGNKCLRRFIDFEVLDDIAFGFEDMVVIKEIRKSANAEYTRTVKIVFYATDSWAYGMANMVRVLMEKENYDIRVTKDIKEAAAFLDIQEGLIRGPSP